MATQNVSQLLGTLQQDPENTEALEELAALADGSNGGVDEETLRLIDSARRGHDQRDEYRAVAKLLEVEARVAADDDPDRAATFYKELGRIYREELLDDASAESAYQRALALRPGDEELQEQIEQIQQAAANWSDFVKRFIEEANNASDPTLKSSLLVSAASLVWKYKEKGRDEEVDELFQEALQSTSGDARAARLYEQILRQRAQYDRLVKVLLETADASRDKEQRLNLFVRAARVLSRELADAGRAAACYERVLDFHPGHPEAMSYLVGYFMEAEDWDHLVSLYEDALRSRTKLEDEAGALLQLGMVHWRFRDDPDAAEPYFGRLRKMDPGHPGMLDFYRAYLADDPEGRWITILADAQRGASSDEQKLQLAIELATAAQAHPQGTERAIDAWKVVLRHDPSNERAPTALKELYERTEKWNALVELLKAEADAIEVEAGEIEAGDGEAGADDAEARIAQKVGLLRHLIPIYRDKLGLDVMVINTYNAILALDPSDDEALDALASTYEQTNRWNDLIGVLSRKADAAPDAETKVELQLQIANLWIDRFANYNQATDPLERVVELQPENREALSRLKEIYSKKRTWNKLYEVLTKEALLASDPGARLANKLELAEIAGKRLHRHADAIALWKEILETAPDTEGALDSLQKLAEREKDWATLAEVLERRVAEAEGDERAQQKLLQKLGTIYGEHLEEPVKAAGAWKRILDLDPKNGRALRTLRETFLASEDFDGLEALYSEAGDWEGLVDVLGNVADKAKDPAIKVRLSFRAAEIYEQELQSPERAFRAYERVLGADPENVRAASALIPLYEAAGKHNRLPALYEVQYQHAQDDGERLELLATMRGLSVERLSDDQAAFGYAARAFELAPQDDDTRATARASAEKADAWGKLVELYLARLDAIDEDADADDERLWLRREVAEVAGSRLGQVDLAIEQLRAILEIRPDDAQASAQLRSLYSSSGQSRELRSLLLSQISHATTDDERVEHLGRLAQLEEETLGDAESAAARYRQILELDPSRGGALEALDRLAVAGERWDEVVEVIQQRRELAGDEAERRALTLRLGETLATHRDDARGALAAFGDVVRSSPEEPRAMLGLEALVAANPELAPEANLLLEETYEAAGEWHKLADVLGARLEATDDPGEQRALRLRYAELVGSRTGDAEGAYRALEAAFLADPGDVELQDRVIEAAEAADQHEALARAMTSAMDGDQLSPDEQSALASKVAHLYDVVLARPEEAEPFYKRVLANDQMNEDAFAALKELYTNAERWDDLQVLYRRKIDETIEPDTKLDLILQVCFLYEELIDDPPRAIAAYREVLEIDPGHPGSRRALERLYERTESWEDLVSLLGEELSRANDDERVGLTQRLGLLHEKKLGQAERAIDCYEQVLQVEPNHKYAREGVERVMEASAEHQPRCARILEPIYEERGDWPELVGALKVQLEGMSDVGERVSMMARIAELEENRLHDPAAAFLTVAASVEADPADPTTRGELGRLATMRDAERDRAAVLERALETVDDSPHLRAEILLELAQLWDERVGDVAQAEATYKRLLVADPDNAQTVLDASQALERIHLGTGNHAELAQDLARQVDLTVDPDEQRRLLVRLADLREEILEDVPGAIEAHQRRLEVDPGDIDAMGALERLYTQEGRHKDLIEVLRRRDETVTDPDEQRDIAKRIGAIYEQQLDDPERAIEAYNDALSRFGADAETLGSLTRLYEQAERWDALLEVAEMVYELAEHPVQRAAVRFQMGEIMRAYTGQVERAVEAYAEVLDLVPDHEGAIEALDFVMRADGTGAAPEDQAAPVDASEADEALPEAATLSEPPPAPDGSVEYPLPVRIDAARVLVPRYEASAHYEPLSVALLVLAQGDDPAEVYGSLRRAAEVADVGLDDAGRAFELQGRAVRAGLQEDDLGYNLRELSRMAGDAGRWADYVALLQEVGPEILDAELQAEAYTRVAEVAREQLGDAALARTYYERVLEIQPENAAALDALEALIGAAEDHPALLDVLRRKTELAMSPEDRVPLLLRRAELCETKLERFEDAIDCYDQALNETQPREAYDGLVRLYAKTERWADLAMHYERMLEDGVGEPVALRHELGLVQLDRLEDPWTAVEQFRHALAMDVSHAPTIAALERLMANEEHRATAAEILEPVFLQQMNWPKVTECLEARIAAEGDIDAKKAHLTRLGQIHEDYLEDLDGALESYARLFREDPRDQSTWETLGRLARVLERHDRVAEIYKEALDDIPGDDDQTARLAFLAGQMFDQRTEDAESAAALYGRALAYDSTDHDAFIALEAVHQRRGAWTELLDLYREQANVADAESDRVALLKKSAHLLEKQLERPEQAVDTYRDILMIDGEDPHAIESLDRLLVEQGRWPELADHLRHQIELAAGEPYENDLKHQLGLVLLDRLEDAHGAIDVFEEITQEDPHHHATVESLERLVQAPEHQTRIIQILEPIYLATDQWRKRIAVYEAQVESITDRFELVRLLSQIAQLHEERAGDRQLAFHAWARAMAAEPDNLDCREQVDRLASELGTWDAHVQAYEHALAQTEDVSVQAALLSRVARVHDEKRGDPRSAITTYERLLEIDADDPAPLDALEALHTMVGDWRGLVDVLNRKVQRAFDPAERGELLRRAGSVLEDLLGDRAGAIEAYQSALMEDDQDDVALEALDRLYAAAGDHERLGDILARRLEIETDPGSRVDLALRFGRLNEEHLRRPDDAIEAYRRALDEDPSQLDAVQALARLYDRQAMWPELLDNLRQQAALHEDREERVKLLFRAGEVLEREMDDVLTALPTYEEVLVLDPRFEPAISALIRISKLEDYRAQASEILEPLLRSQERWDELASLLSAKVSAAYDPEDKRVELRRLAEVHEAGRGDRDAAFEAYVAALAEEPSDEESADDIERLAAELGAWERAADAFAVRASSTLDPEVARALYGRLAAIAEGHLGDDARAVEAYSRAIEQAGDDDEALRALDRLYSKLSAWEDLAEILDRRVQSSMDPDERAELLVRLGTLKQQQFGDLSGAFRAFSEVLERDPSEPRAVAAMESLLEDDALARDVVEVLEPVYRQTQATEKVAALFDVRVHLADTDGERVRFLQDQAVVYENELGDHSRALEALRRAFDLDPSDEGLVSDVERLAPMADGGFESLRGMVERVLEDKGDDLDRMLLRDLNMRSARWYRDHLGDPAAAEARLRAAIAADPDTHEAHEALVELLRQPGREDALVSALVHWADVDYDEDAKKQRLTEAAQLAEGALGNRALAIRGYEKILEVDAGHPNSLEQLVRLERDAGNHERVAELLVTRIEVEMEPDARLVQRKQLAATYAALDRTDEAIDAWQGALDEVPTDLECIDALERLYEKTERWSDLEELVQRRLDVAETPADRIAARVRLARLAESRFGRRDEAIEQLQDILEEDPGNPEALDELERLYVSGEAWDELVALLEGRVQDAQARGEAGEELAYLVRLGSVHVENRGDTGEGVAIYGRVLARDPEHHGALQALVDLHRQREEWPEVADSLQRLLAVQEGDEARATAVEIAELSEERLDDPARTEAALRYLYELDGGSRDARERLKAHYEKHAMADKLAMMLAMDEEETEDVSEKVALLKRIADLYSGPLSDPASAAQYLERASQLNPEDRDVLLPLCDLYIAAGRQSDAIPVLEQIVASYGSRRNKEVAVYHHRLGLAKESMGDLDGALESFDAAFKVDLTNVAVLRDLGRLCLTRGDLDRAQKTFRALLLQKLSPDAGISKADVYFYLGDISARQGDERKAISMLERAVAEDPEHAQAAALLGQLKG